MRLIVFCFFVSISYFASGQQTLKVVLPKKDTSLLPNSKNIDNMPIDASATKWGFVYEGSNGMGFDIYRNTLDNMSVLRPDSHFKDKMGNVMTQPKLNNRLMPYWNQYFLQPADSLNKSDKIDFFHVRPNKPNIFPDSLTKP